MSFQIKAFIFILISTGLVWISWPSLKNIRSHGLYRFFAWESILAMVMYNLDNWFYKPFSVYQLISWILLLISLLMVIYGYQSIRLSGMPDSSRIDPSLRGIEKTTELVTSGAYRYIRHPLYSSILFGAWGVFFKRITLLSVCLAVITTLSVIITAKIEEVENIRFFGQAYREYMRKTRMLIPFIY